MDLLSLFKCLLGVAQACSQPKYRTAAIMAMLLLAAWGCLLWAGQANKPDKLAERVSALEKTESSTTARLDAINESLRDLKQLGQEQRRDMAELKNIMISKRR